jgi:predicted permease
MLSRRYQELLQRLQAIPGVRSAALSGTTPIEGSGASRFITVEGFHEETQARRRVALNGVGPRYFETFGTPLFAGRDFQFEDEARPRVAIVNRAMARYYFADRSPIGAHFTFDGLTQPYEIVGVVGDAKYAEIHSDVPRTVYLNAFQDGRGQSSQFSLRTNVAPAAVAADVRRAVDEVLRTVRVTKVTTLAEQVDAAIVSERLIATLSGLFGALGAGLAAVGLYGLLAFTVVRRTSEIGVRMALGATERDVTRMVLKDALILVSVGLLLGVPVAFWSKRFAGHLLENLSIDITYPLVFAAAAMIAVAALAAYVPARRAARVEPIDALRR